MNPYDYDTALPWTPQQNQFNRGEDGRVYGKRSQVLQDPRAQVRVQPGGGAKKPKGAERMPKARALALVSKLKKGLIVASFMSFGTVSGLAAYHQIATTTSTTSTTSSGSSQSTSTSTSSSQNSSGFLNQGGNNFGSTSSSSGTTSGSSSSGSSSGSSSSSSSSQSPVTGSQTS